MRAPTIEDGFDGEQRALFGRVTAAPAAQLPRLLDELSVVELRDVKLMAGAVARGNWPLREAVDAAVRRRARDGQPR